MLGDCLSRVERPVEVKSNELYTQIGIRSHEPPQLVRTAQKGPW